MRQLAEYCQQLERALITVPIYQPGGHGVEHAYLTSRDAWLNEYDTLLRRAMYNPERERALMRIECSNQVKQTLNRIRANNNRHHAGDPSASYLDINQAVAMIEEQLGKLR